MLPRVGLPLLNSKKQANLLSQMTNPNLNLDNLFRYAVPVLQNKGYQIDIVCFEQKGFNVCAWDVIHNNGESVFHEDDDLAVALSNVIYEVMEAMEE